MNLVLPFDTDDPQFRRGIEIGVLWQQLEYEPSVHVTIHADCTEMVMRIAEARKLPFCAEPIEDAWMHVSIGENL